MLTTIAEEKNITKAAERLYVSQPALTYRLKNLEKAFRTQLFIRTSSGITLTSQGEQLLAYAQDMLLQLTKTKERIQNMATGVHGSLRLGSSSIFAHYELPQILKGFLANYPDVEVSLHTGLSGRVSRMLEKEEISVAIVRGDHVWQEEKYLLSEEPICLASLHPIALTDLPDKPRINYQTDSSLQQMLEEWWRQTFFRPGFVSMEVDNLDTCRQMVLHNLGWAIIPAIGLQQHDQLYTRELYWKNGDPVRRRTWVICRHSAMQLSAVKAFVEYLRFKYDSP